MPLIALAGAVLLFLAWPFDQNAEFRQSASALVRLLRTSEDSETGYRWLMRATGGLLLVLAALQVITLMPFLRKPSNRTRHTDVRPPNRM